MVVMSSGRSDVSSAITLFIICLPNDDCVETTFYKMNSLRIFDVYIQPYYRTLLVLNNFISTMNIKIQMYHVIMRKQNVSCGTFHLTWTL